MNKLQRQKLIDLQLGKRQKNYNNSMKNHQGIDIEKKRIIHSLNEIKSQWSYRDIEEALAYIFKTKSKSFDYFQKTLQPKSYEDIYKEFIFTRIDGNLDRELCWNSIIFNCFSEKISMYVKLKNKYENLLINGKYENAEKILDEIDENLGVSLWGLDNRFIIREYMGGLDKNKEYLAEINSLKCDNWIAIMADFFSFKAEQGINNRQYSHRIEKLLERADAEVKPFFVEKLFPLYKIDLDDIYSLLFYSGASSFIDRYNAYIKACLRIVSDSDADDQMRMAVKNSILLIGDVEDIVVDKLKLYVDNDKSIRFTKFDDEMLTVGDLYTSGKYDEVIEITTNLMNEKSNCFELYEYYVKAFVMSGKCLNTNIASNIRSELIEGLYVAYVKDEKTPKSYLVVSKYARLFSNSYFGTQVDNFFADKYMIGISDTLLISKEYMSQFNNIKLIQALPDIDGKIVRQFEEKYEQSSTVKLIKYVYSECKNCETEMIDVPRLRWYKIKKNIQKENAITELCNWLEELQGENGSFQIYHKERISTALYYLYIEKNLILAAEEVLVNNYINNKYNTLRMDTDALFDNTNRNSKEIKNSICTPIVTYLYNRNDYAKIYAATANFLDYNHVEKPSELIGSEEKFDRKQLIYFFRFVCMIEVLDSLSAFETDDDVENERIEICQILQKYDNINDNVYIEEISQIMQRRKILQGMKYLEDVKIDLDINKVSTEQIEIFNDNYKRFCHIGELDIKYSVLDASNRIYLKSYSDGKKYDYKLTVFKEMLLDYRDEIAFGKYGIDQTLGTRIRHGSLQNQIRVAFEKNNIAFVRKSREEAIYLPTIEFENNFSWMDKELRDSLYKCISEFSEEIDEYVELLKSNYLRIKTENLNTEGLIDFSVCMDELKLIFENAQKLQNENLVLEFFENYWLEKTEIGLENIRNYFGDQVKKQYINMLNKLEESLRCFFLAEQVNNIIFDSISRARTETQNSIDIIIDWFKLPTKQEYNSFDAKSLIETCEMINQRVFTNYELIEVKKNILLETKIFGRTFPYLIDILIILFTNAYYHSGFRNDINSLKVTLEMTEIDEYVVICMKNNIAHQVDRIELANTIYELKQKLAECINKREYYNYEGKSGYIKICKILDYNLVTRLNLEFGMDEEQENFISTIRILKNSILEKVVNSN